MLERVRDRFLGLAVFVGVLVIWQVWAQQAGSFLMPPPSDVLDRAWHVWPTRDFLADVAASLTRLAIGFAIGAGVGIAIGLPMGPAQWAAMNRVRTRYSFDDPRTQDAIEQWETWKTTNPPPRPPGRPPTPRDETDPPYSPEEQPPN